jgi:hypothetical protein
LQRAIQKKISNWIHLCHCARRVVRLLLSGGMPMPLPRAPGKETLNYSCPRCGHVLSKRGSWFVFSRGFTCASCQGRIQMTYEAKLKLFEDYERNRSPSALNKGHAFTG